MRQRVRGLRKRLIGVECVYCLRPGYWLRRAVRVGEYLRKVDVGGGVVRGRSIECMTCGNELPRCVFLKEWFRVWG